MDRLLRLIAIMILLAASAGSVHGQEVREHAMFCRTDGRIAADSSAMRTAEWRNLVVSDFLKYADCPCDVAGLDYCDRYRSMSIDDSTRVSVDCVTFPSGDEALVKWLDGIPDSTYVEIDIPAKAPEKCIAFRKETTLVIVWCNLFADSDKITYMMKLILTNFATKMLIYRSSLISNTPDYRSLQCEILRVYRSFIIFVP